MMKQDDAMSIVFLLYIIICIEIQNEKSVKRIMIFLLVCITNQDIKIFDQSQNLKLWKLCDL